MLKIWFENNDDYVLPIADKIKHKVSPWFNTYYKQEWANDPFVKEMVKGVDKSELFRGVVISPIFGSISVRDLSSGVKTLISIYCAGNPDGIIFNTRSCGNNCSYWLAEIGKRRDVEIAMSIFMREFPNEFEFICMNNGVTYHSYKDYVNCGNKLLCEGILP